MTGEGEGERVKVTIAGGIAIPRQARILRNVIVSLAWKERESEREDGFSYRPSFFSSSSLRRKKLQSFPPPKRDRRRSFFCPSTTPARLSASPARSPDRELSPLESSTPLRKLASLPSTHHFSLADDVTAKERKGGGRNAEEELVSRRGSILSHERSGWQIYFSQADKTVRMCPSLLGDLVGEAHLLFRPPSLLPPSERSFHPGSFQFCEAPLHPRLRGQSKFWQVRRLERPRRHLTKSSLRHQDPHFTGRGGKRRGSLKDWSTEAGAAAAFSFCTGEVGQPANQPTAGK